MPLEEMADAPAREVLDGAPTDDDVSLLLVRLPADARPAGEPVEARHANGPAPAGERGRSAAGDRSAGTGGPGRLGCV